MWRLGLGFCFLLTWAVPALAQERWIAHYTRDGGGFATDLHLVSSDFDAAHEVRLIPFARDGTRLESLERVFKIGPGHRVTAARSDLGWQDQPVSHVRVEGTEAVRVFAAYRNLAAGSMPALAPAKTSSATTARFVPFQSPAWFDGLVAVNLDNEPGTVIISAHDTQGNTLRSTAVTVSANGKWLDVLAAVFGEPLAIDGYVQLQADRPMMFFALRGSLAEIQPAVLTELPLDTFRGVAAKLSYSNQVSRIIDRKCGFCHVQGGIGPFPLTNFEEAFSFRNFMEPALENGLMPPWKASDQCAELTGSQALDPLEKEMLLEWIRSDAPRGDPARAPLPRPPLASDWQGGEPELVVAYEEPFFFEPGPDVYRCFPISLNNSEPLYVKSLEILPGNPEIVHHVLVFIEGNEEGFANDAQEDGPGYTCFGGPGTSDIRLLTGWAPGMTPQKFPADVGMTIPPHSTIIMQVHYHYSLSAGSDQTRVGIQFYQEPHEKELLLLPLVNQDFIIPAGAKDYIVEQSVTLPALVSAELYTVAPHMHLLGTSISVEAVFPDQSELCLVDIPRWDFNWQRFYEYPNPIHLPGGTTVSLFCTFDNSPANPNNPFDPPLDVGWGEATTDEMALAFLGVVVPLLSGKDGGDWRWPLTIDNRKPSLYGAGSVPASKLKARVPSCCRPGIESKPWKACPATTEAPTPNPRPGISPAGPPL